MVTGDPWQALLAQAVLGARQGRKITAAGALGEVLARVPAEDAVAATALITAWRRAGRLPPQLAALPPAAPAETLPEASPTATRLLRRFLAEGGERELAWSWIEACARAGRRAAAVDAPALLDLGQAQAALRDPLRRIVGARGAWLAAQHAAWAWAVAAPSAAAWPVSTASERLALLRRMRAVEPAAAGALVLSTWDEDPPAERAAFIAAFGAGLAAVDEPLLERALDDRRKEVRQAAAELCRRLPGAALAARCQERLATCWTWTRKLFVSRLQLEPPPEYAAAWARDGIEQKPPSGIGERAWWLQQLVGAVPVTHWSAAWEMPPAKVLAAVATTDWDLPFVSGLVASCQAQPDQAWVEALAAHPAGAPHLAALVARLAGAAQERLLAAAAPAGGKEAQAWLAAVGAIDSRWSLAFSRRIVDVMRTLPPAEWGGGLAQAARRLHPGCADDLANLPRDPAWDAHRDAALTILDLRRQILQEFP